MFLYIYNVTCWHCARPNKFELYAELGLFQKAYEMKSDYRHNQAELIRHINCSNHRHYQVIIIQINKDNTLSG